MKKRITPVKTYAPIHGLEFPRKILFEKNNPSFNEYIKDIVNTELFETEMQPLSKEHSILFQYYPLNIPKLFKDIDVMIVRFFILTSNKEINKNVLKHEINLNKFTIHCSSDYGTDNLDNLFYRLNSVAGYTQFLMIIPTSAKYNFIQHCIELDKKYRQINTFHIYGKELIDMLNEQMNLPEDFPLFLVKHKFSIESLVDGTFLKNFIAYMEKDGPIFNSYLEQRKYSTFLKYLEWWKTGKWAEGRYIPDSADVNLNELLNEHVYTINL